MHFLSGLGRSSSASHQLVNVTRGVVLAQEIEPAFDSASRRRGLLGRDSLDARTAIVIAPSSAIHTIGMRFPIDLLFVARDGRVLKRVTGLKRWRMSAHFRAFAVIEFCADHTGVRRTEPGDVLCVLTEKNPAADQSPVRAAASV